MGDTKIKDFGEDVFSEKAIRAFLPKPVAAKKGTKTGAKTSAKTGIKIPALKGKKKKPQTVSEDPDEYYDENAEDSIANQSDETSGIMDEESSQVPEETDEEAGYAETDANPDQPSEIDFNSETGNDENDEEDD